MGDRGDGWVLCEDRERCLRASRINVSDGHRTGEERVRFMAGGNCNQISEADSKEIKMIELTRDNFRAVNQLRLVLTEKGHLGHCDTEGVAHCVLIGDEALPQARGAVITGYLGVGRKTTSSRECVVQTSLEEELTVEHMRGTVEWGSPVGAGDRVRCSDRVRG